jgi:hypothetical protein
VDRRRQGLTAGDLDLVPARVGDARLVGLLTGLHPTAVDHHRRDPGRLRILRGQFARPEGLHIGVAGGGPLAADPLGDLGQVVGADRHLRQFLQVVTGVLERGRLTGLAHRLAQDGGAVALGPPLESLVQGGKRRPDRSCTAIALG